MPPTLFYYSDVSKNKYHIKILSYPNENIQRWNVMVTASSKPIKRAVAAQGVGLYYHTIYNCCQRAHSGGVRVDGGWHVQGALTNVAWLNDSAALS